MYEPKFTYTDRLVGQLIKLEHSKALIHAMDMSNNIKHKLVMNAKSLDMFHLAHSLEVDITLRDAEKLATGIKPESVDDFNAQVIQNFRNVLEFNRSSMVDTYAEIDTPIIMHLNKLMLTGWKEQWEVKFRTNTEKPDPKADDWAIMADSEIDPNTISQQMDELIEWYKDITPTITPVVRFAIFMYRLIEIYPFMAGNKVSIMALMDYLMLKNGLASKAYTSVVKNFHVNTEKYMYAFRISKTNFDLAYWIETFVDTLNKDMQEVRESINEFMVEDEKSKKQPFLDLNKRQLKILRYLQSVPFIQREDYCHMMEVSTMTAFRDLNDLLRKKLIKVEGQGRGTKYRLASM